MEYSVYVLRLNKLPVYVGMTSNIKTRIQNHRSQLKVFDGYLVIEKFESKKEALIFERAIIKFLSIFPIESITNKKYENVYIQMK